jgi:hypothetical protein
MDDIQKSNLRNEGSKSKKFKFKSTKSCQRDDEGTRGQDNSNDEARRLAEENAR